VHSIREIIQYLPFFVSNDNRCILWKNINQNSNPSWHKQPVYRCPPSADGYSPTKRNCGKWAYLPQPRYCHPWLSDTFARNTASTSIEPHKTKKNEKIRKEQKKEERNRKPFLFFVIPLQRISKNCLQLSLIVDPKPIRLIRLISRF